MKLRTSARDLSGKKFGRLTALKPTRERLNGSVVWECLCDCGTKKKASAQSLNSGGVKSCGCLAKEAILKNRKKRGYKRVDLTKSRFGRLQPVELVGVNPPEYRCICDCGEETVVPGHRLTSRQTRSCGCLRSEKSSERGEENFENGQKILSKARVEGTDLYAISPERKRRSDNTSGVVGVYWNKRAELWFSSIGFKGEVHHLGYFKNKEDAINARKEAEEKYFKPVLERHTGEPE